VGTNRRGATEIFGVNFDPWDTRRRRGGKEPPFQPALPAVMRNSTQENAELGASVDWTNRVLSGIENIQGCSLTGIGKFR